MLSADLQGEVLKFADGGSALIAGPTMIVFTQAGHPLSPPRATEGWTAAPSADAWLEFWRTVDELSVWTWGSRADTRWVVFGAGPSATDGRRWSLELRHGERSLKLDGYNEFPVDFDKLRAALYALTGHSGF